MFKRGRVQPRPEVLQAFAAFRRVLASVEGAKRRLASAAPGGRSAGVPLAAALAGFEDGLREAAAAMTGWRVIEVEQAWTACVVAVAEAERRAERLRLDGAPTGYEELHGILGDLMDPLDAFADALVGFRSVGV